jgi:hypothetical protein
MLNIVEKIQSSITLSIVSGMFESQSIEVAVRVLDIFNSANNKKDRKNYIDYKEFYNDAINKEVSLKDHYLLWL